MSEMMDTNKTSSMQDSTDIPIIPVSESEKSTDVSSLYCSFNLIILSAN